MRLPPSIRALWVLQASRLRLAFACALLALLGPLSVAAEGISIRNAAVELSEDGYSLNADFDVQFSARLEEAVARGVPLYFIVEAEISRPRWYWFDEKPVVLTRTYKISYTPLLRQYRLEVGTVYQNFTRFEELKRVLSRIRGWHIADKGALAKEVPYQASIRMRLDTAQLPKPFQLNAVASRDWSVNSEWHRWSVTP